MIGNELKAYDGLTSRQQLNLFRNLYYNDGNATEYGIIANAINDCFTADVVPRVELDAMRGAANSYKMHYEKAKQEADRLAVELEAEKTLRVVRIERIFEEIYKTMNSVYASVQHSCVGMHGDNPETMRLLGKLEGIKHLGDEIAELKKKYMEGGQSGTPVPTGDNEGGLNDGR